MSFKEYKPDEYTTNIVKRVAEEWLLITAKKPDGSVNTMTASWGGIGVMWGKPVCFCAVRHHRYTHEFTEAADRITLSFLDEDKRDAHTVCGSKSGRDCDKLALAGLHRIDEDDYTYFEESSEVIVGRKIYEGELAEANFIDKSILDKHYPKRDLHTIYVCEIEKVIVKE